MSESIEQVPAFEEYERIAAQAFEEYQRNIRPSNP